MLAAVALAVNTSRLFLRLASLPRAHRGVVHEKVKLAWRKSSGVRRSLGWIPFKASGIAYVNGRIRYGKVWLSLWDSHGLKDYELGPGSISEDARSRWYVNICAMPKQKPMQLSLLNESTGIDLGLKHFAATRDG
ncbi:MAG: hypothetical protein ABIQ44_12490, partial [Chloroflexia bacterium]